MKLTSILFAAAILAGMAAEATAQTPTNRRVDAIGVVQLSPDKWGVHAVWTVELGQQTTAPLDLSTEAVLFINGVEEARELVDIMALAGAGGCGSCAPGCGEGAVNGMAAALLCLSEGQVGCSCQFPPFTSSFNVELDPLDDITIQLEPAAGAIPDSDQSDNRKAHTFNGIPVTWDRHLVRAALVPTAGAPVGVFDLEVEWQLSTSDLVEQVELTPSFEVLVNGQVMFIFEPPCGPWIAAPHSVCILAECPGSGCGTISCNGGAQQSMKCTLTENDVGLQYCACLMPQACLEVIPGLTILDPANDDIKIVMKPVPGALPELPGLEKDDTKVPEIESPWTDLGHALAGTHGDPELTPFGSMISGTPIELIVKNALETTNAWLVVGLSNLSAPFKGGVLVPNPAAPGLTLPLPTDIEGSAGLNAPLPLGLPSGFDLYFQWWIQDTAGPAGFAASNAVRGVTP